MAKRTANDEVIHHVKTLCTNHECLQGLQDNLMEAFWMCVSAFESGGKMMVCGNGGSAADADHIVGELMKGFLKSRPLDEATMHKLGPNARYLQKALPAVSLLHPASLVSAFINDVGTLMMFAQQVYGLGRPGDVLIAISTSGNSENVLNAVEVAKGLGIRTVALTGLPGGRLKDTANVCIAVPRSTTVEIQELHLPIYHALCAMLESHFF